MDYKQDLKYHFKPKKGWVNDPNGLVYFNGYYHVFYQHAPDSEVCWQQSMHWGHARTKDFVTWEELPVALYPDKYYDQHGCWSGTAVVKDGVLYLFYASIRRENKVRYETVSVAYSTDGIHFKKYENNPVINHYPADGKSDFRDPAVALIDGVYYCVMASGHDETETARLLLYKSEDMFNWEYIGIMGEWQNARFTECPSFLQTNDGYLLTTSVCYLDSSHFFSVNFGDFKDGKFKEYAVGLPDKGPDQYAGQTFPTPDGRGLLIAWLPGWKYENDFEKNVGCMSLPRELVLENGQVLGKPAKEIRHLLTDTDPALTMTDDGFIIHREGREPVVHKGEIRDLKMLRDGYILEVFVNDGEQIYSVLL